VLLPKIVIARPSLVIEIPPDSGLGETLMTTVDPGSVAEFLGASVALVALAISVIAYRVSAKSGKQTVFLGLQEFLNSERAASGRRSLHLLRSEGQARRIHMFRPKTWETMNYSVNQLNTLAQYSRRGIVDADLAVSIWGRATRDSWPGLEIMIRYRRSFGRADKWSSLIWFAHRAGVAVPVDLEPADPFEVNV
jgi:hypothetical protein